MPSPSRTFPSILFAFLVVAAGGAVGPWAYADDSSRIAPGEKYAAAVERIRGLIEYDLADKDLPALSIAWVDGENVVWAEGFGFADPDAKVPADALTVYRVGSVSKLFTDIAAMQLVEQGKLDLDRPVTEYLDDFHPRNPFDKPITLRQLMTHLSGLVRESPVGHYFDPNEPTLRETVRSLNGTALVYRPETRTKYSNAGIAVVGYVVERMLGRPFHECVQENVLEPIGMKHSSYELTDAVRQRLAKATMWTYDGRTFPAPEWGLGTSPAGNLYSTVLDLARFAQVLFEKGQSRGGRILRPESLDEMMQPQFPDVEGQRRFGIGFALSELDGHLQIGHGGAVYGFSTQFEVLPEEKLAVIVVASKDGTNGCLRRIAELSLKSLLAVREGQELPAVLIPGPVPAELARRMDGRYVDAEAERQLRLVERNGSLFLHRGSFRYAVKSLGDRFVTDDALGFGMEIVVEDSEKIVVDGAAYTRISESLPEPALQAWRGLIGEYGWDHNALFIREEGGRLYALIEWFYDYPLTQESENVFAFPDYGLYHGEKLIFERDEHGEGTKVTAAEVVFERRAVGTAAGETFKITPLRPADELRAIAMQASPPVERGEFREPELVELTSLDASILLDIRYATTNNFVGEVFYTQPRAFLQRPAAEAVVRAHRRLKEHGLGLLIHDAYRPWFVTKMFWDATPDDLKLFVANPERGSRHNRGCAVDLTLYDLETKEPVETVAGYDEFSPRSFPDYPGGTSRQRWYRELLRDTMEAEGFTIYEFEWWHFDYKDWEKYPIQNVTFESIR